MFMFFRTANLWLAHTLLSAQDARGPEDEDHERTWRSAFRHYDAFCDSMPKKIMLPSRSATSKSRRP